VFGGEGTVSPRSTKGNRAKDEVRGRTEKLLKTGGGGKKHLRKALEKAQAVQSSVHREEKTHKTAEREEAKRCTSTGRERETLGKSSRRKVVPGRAKAEKRKKSLQHENKDEKGRGGVEKSKKQLSA